MDELHGMVAGAVRVRDRVLVIGAALAIAGALLLPAVVRAGPASAVPDPRDPADGTRAGWTYTTYSIPGLPGGTALGAMCKTEGISLPGRPIPYPPPPPEPGSPPITGNLYVWAMQGGDPIGSGGYAAHPEPGEREGRGERVTSSTLWLWNGSGWSMVLIRPDETGNTVFGTGATDVFAVTTTTGGRVRMFHFDDVGDWAEQALPQVATGPAGAMDGVTGDVWFRIGGSLLHWDGAAWNAVYANPALAAGGALEYLAADDVWAIGPGGAAHWDGVAWRYEAAHELGTVAHAWGMRDAGGVPHLFATGARGDELVVWQHAPDPTGVGLGCWGNGVLLNDPAPGEQTPEQRPLGTGLAIAGTAPDRVYAAGACIDHDCGRLYGLMSSPPVTMLPHDVYAPFNDILARPEGDVWLTTAAGTLVRVTQPALARDRAPIVTRAVAEPGMLYDSHGEWATISITGVTDPEGGPVRITVTGITQDEPVVMVGESRFDCPDAVIGEAGQFAVRVECASGYNGRVYRAAFDAVDVAGNISHGRAYVRIQPCPMPEDCYPLLAIDDGQLYVSTGDCALRHGGDAGPAVQMRPVGGSTFEFQVALDRKANVRFTAFDVSGRRAATMEPGTWGAGTHTLVWNARDVAAGVYFCRIHAGDATVTRTVIVRR